jgi:drug/metabolite transporter (DMT)-like permease
VLVAIGWGAGGQIGGFTWPAGLLLVYMAFLSAVAFALWGVLLKYNRVSTVALYSFLVPVFGAGLSALFLGESLLEWKYLVALLLVSLGIYRVTKEQ